MQGLEVRVRVRVSSLVFVERKVGGSKLSVLEVSSLVFVERNVGGRKLNILVI